MKFEIERKFEVIDPPLHLAFKVLEIRQCYMSDKLDLTMRARITTDVTTDKHVTTAEVTAKGKGDLTGAKREENEIVVPTDFGQSLFLMCSATKRPVIEKTRYAIKQANHIFEIDVFTGKHAGKILAEVELLDIDESFEKPAWLGKEVTGDPRYYNLSMAKHNGTVGAGILGLASYAKWRLTRLLDYLVRK